MSTYSISSGITYTEKLVNLISVLKVLPDNTQKLIAPRDVRDAIYTTWENISFKSTSTPGSGEYIGIDREDLVSKVYFGKKTAFGDYVVTNKLLNEDIDFYFYNSRDDGTIGTRIAILSGSPSSFYVENQLGASFIETKGSVGGSVNLEVRNTSYKLDGFGNRIGGDVNLLSDKGYVSLNGFVFPKISQNNQSTNDNKFLKFVWDSVSQQGFATWSTPNAIPVTEIISAGTVSISGSPVLINGRNVNFTSTIPVPTTIGGIAQGSTFNDEPVTEVLRKLLYPYLPPTISTNFQYSFIESGDTTSFSNQKLNYSIVRPGTFSINSISANPSGGTIPTSPSTIPQNNVGISDFYIPTFQTSGDINLLSTVSNKTISRVMTVTDLKPSSVTATSSFSVVIPWFYGTSTTLATTATQFNNILGGQTFTLNKLTALLKSAPSSGESVSLSISTIGLASNQGCIYFGYPSSYSDVLEIRDDNDFDVTTSFTKVDIIGINSPTSPQRWGNRTYKFYVYTQIPSGSPSLTTVPNFSQFKLIFP